MIFRHLLNMRSHPTWVRGLKHNFTIYKITECLVAPYVGAWIETSEDILPFLGCSSHPTWVRGLKLSKQASCMKDDGSHPTWVRGLKLVTSKALLPSSWSHPTWVRGLKHISGF